MLDTQEKNTLGDFVGFYQYCMDWYGQTQSTTYTMMQMKYYLQQCLYVCATLGTLQQSV